MLAGDENIVKQGPRRHGAYEQQGVTVWTDICWSSIDQPKSVECTVALDHSIHASRVLQ